MITSTSVQSTDQFDLTRVAGLFVLAISCCLFGCMGYPSDGAAVGSNRNASVPFAGYAGVAGEDVSIEAFSFLTAGFQPLGISTPASTTLTQSGGTTYGYWWSTQGQVSSSFWAAGQTGYTARVRANAESTGPLLMLDNAQNYIDKPGVDIRTYAFEPFDLVWEGDGAIAIELPASDCAAYGALDTGDVTVVNWRGDTLQPSVWTSGCSVRLDGEIRGFTQGRPYFVAFSLTSAGIQAGVALGAWAAAVDWTDEFEVVYTRWEEDLSAVWVRFSQPLDEDSIFLGWPPDQHNVRITRPGETENLVASVERWEVNGINWDIRVRLDPGVVLPTCPSGDTLILSLGVEVPLLSAAGEPLDPYQRTECLVVVE